MASKRPRPNGKNSQEKNKSSKLFNTSFRSDYKSLNFKNSFRDSFTSTTETKLSDGSDVVILKKPFRCCILPNFIEDTKFLSTLKDELSKFHLKEKNNDLYKFHQSEDLKNITSPAIESLKRLLYEDFKSWLQDITRIALNETVDMNCSQYEYTDVLLCHDDELEGRRIAFIFYLVDLSWSTDYGGTLDLFDTDSNGQPSTVLKTLIPKQNNFVFFEVTPTSFHQVSEVLSKDAVRLSVSGWFHGVSISRDKPFVEPKEILKIPSFVEESVLRAWINPLYLEATVQVQIREKFQADSEIELQNFLQATKYEELAEVLLDKAIKWDQKGPANKRHFSAAEENSFPAVMGECLTVLRSEAMFLILSNITGLRLHSLAPESESSSSEDEEKETEKGVVQQGPCNATCWSLVRRWGHGDYTLIHDQDEVGSEWALDANLFFNCQDWKAEYGGYTSYIAKGEDEELLTVYPRPNSLTLVYRDKETLRFVKHVNHRVTERTEQDKQFQDIFCVYYE